MCLQRAYFNSIANCQAFWFFEFAFSRQLCVLPEEYMLTGQKSLSFGHQQRVELPSLSSNPKQNFATRNMTVNSISGISKCTCF